MKYLIDNDMNYSLRLRMLYTPVVEADTLLGWGNLVVSIDANGVLNIKTGTFDEDIVPDEAIIWLDIVREGTTYDIYFNGSIITTHSDPFVYSPFMTVGSKYTIDTLTIWPEYLAGPEDISEDYEDVLAEQIFCDFNKNTLMRTRCNVTPYVLGGVNTVFIKEQAGTGSPQANTTSFTLKNNQGQFADDQYGSFDPETGNYNGTTDEKFLRNKVGVETEVKINGEIEPLFRGRVDDSRFPRSEVPGKVNKVSVSAKDLSEVISTREVKTTRYYKEHYLSSSDEDYSLFHKLAELALEHEISQFIHNSAFGAGVFTPWTTSGAVIGTGGLFSGIATLTAGSIKQSLTDMTIRAGETYYVDVYLSGSSAEIKAEKYYDSVLEESATSTLSPDANVKRYRLEYKTDTSGDRLDITVSGSCVIHGVQCSRQAPVLFIQNSDTDSPTDDNGSYSAYMPVGVKISPQLYQQGFSVIRTGSIWGYLKQMHVAGIGMYLGFSKGGVFTWKNYSVDRVNLGDFPSYTNIRQLVTALSKEFNIMTVSGVEITKISRGAKKLVFSSDDSAMQITEDIFDAATTSVQNAIQEVYNAEDNVCDLVYLGETAPTEKLFGEGFSVQLKEASE